MARNTQTGTSTGAGRMQWALEQRFPKPPSTFGRANHLVRLQSVDPEVHCVLYSDNLTLSSTHGTTVWFRIVPSPLQPRFVIELRFGPSHSQTVIAASFAAYDDFNGNRRLQNRTPHVWTGTHGNVAPRGPLDFSRQLFQVMFRTGADPGRSPLNIHGVEPAAQLNFSWQSDTYTRYRFSHPHARLPRDVVQAIDKFKAILDQASTRGTRLGVVTRNSPRMPTLFWPWFCCQPSPTVPSWWPWLRKLNIGQPKSIMNSPSSEFELDTAYINKAFGVRPDAWYVPGAANFQDVNNVPQPLSIAKVPAVSRFSDHREYLAHVLGSHDYEEIDGRNDIENYYNGEHWVDVYPDDRPESMRYLILLNIRALKAGEVILEPGESVLIHITWAEALGDESWTGRIIPVPTAYEKFGHNVAINALRTPVLGGRALGHQQKVAYLTFAHPGVLTTRLRQKAIQVMAGGDSFWKSWLLAQDNYSLDRSARTDDLPKNWKQQVDTAIHCAGLNNEQAQAVRSYFEQNVTMVVGPPCTGKSILVDVIVSLEQAFGCQYWVYAHSNAGVDALANKLCDRLNTTSPRGFFRLRAKLFHRFMPEIDDGRSIGQHALPSTRPTQPIPLDAIGRHLEEADRVAEALPMSLETLVHARMRDVLDRGQATMFEKEKNILQDLRDAINHVSSLYRDRNTVLTDAALDEAIQEEGNARASVIQRLLLVKAVYVKKSQGMFSTIKPAAPGVLINAFAPHGLIVSEASQMQEARAIYPILHAHAEGNLRRVLIIGDRSGPAPVLKAERNPFSATGSVSLMERQILAGTPYIELRTQHHA